MGGERLWGAGVGLLRAVHLWTGRHYRRAVMRHALRRIGQELVAERRAREQEEKLKTQKRKAGVGRVGVGCSKGPK